MPWLNIMTPRTSKDTVEFILCWSYTAGHGLYPWEYFSQWVSLEEKLFFIYKWLSIGNSFWVKDRGMFQLLFSALGPHLEQTCVVLAHIVLVFVSSYVYWFYCIWKAWFLDVLHQFWLLQFSCLLFNRIPLDLMGGIWRRHIYVCVFCSFSFSAYCLAVSLCICLCLWQEEASLMMSKQGLIYK